LRILFIGDVVGRPGRTILEQRLESIRLDLDIDLTIVNGENAAGGMGITAQVAREIFDLGVDAITLGNHVWDKKDILDYIGHEPRLLRPLNWPGNPPGNGSVILNGPRGTKVAVLSLHGRVFFPIHLDDPFRLGLEEITRLRRETPVIIVDFHGEATSEKIAMGWFLDGRVSAVVGTHTHVQTADEVILPKGTAFITDVGMTGPYQSVIGVETDLVVNRFLSQMPTRFEVAGGPARIAGLVVDVDDATGRAKAVRRILEH
jgi:metallophosphoesterase (TIGR00282 family)